MEGLQDLMLSLDGDMSLCMMWSEDKLLRAGVYAAFAFLETQCLASVGVLIVYRTK